MHLYRKVKQLFVAFVFALAIGFTILLVASAITSHAPRSLPSPAAVDPGDWPEGFAVVVGINDYPGTVNDLSYCVPDARGVAALLPKLGFTPEHVVTVADGAAKKANLTAEIAKIAPQMGPNDVFVLYYSGHGNFAVNATVPCTCNIHTPHNYPNYYDTWWTIHHEGALAIRVRFDNFATENGYDFGYVCDPDWYGYEYTGSKGSFWSGWITGDTAYVGLWSDNIYTAYGFDVTAYEAALSFTGSIEASDGLELTGTEIAAALAPVRAGDQYLFFDSCFSGAMIPALSRVNRSIITACGQNEYSLESPALKHGIFTSYFLSAFNTVGTGIPLPCDSNRDNHTTAAEIFAYVEPCTVSRSTSEGYAQHPQFETRARIGAAWDFDHDHDGLFNWEEARDADQDGLSDGEEIKWYHTDPKKRDTDGDLFDDGWEVANGFDPLDRNSPAALIGGIVVACTVGAVTAGSVYYSRHHQKKVARSSPPFAMYTPAPNQSTSIASPSMPSRFAPAYHAPDAGGHLVPVFKGHDAGWWGMMAQALEQRGYWNDALAAAEVARQLRCLETNPPAWARAESERLAARRTPSCPRCGYLTPKIICPNCGTVTDRRPLLPARAPAPVATPAIDTFLVEPAPEPGEVEEITVDKSKVPAQPGLQPIQAPETPPVDVAPAPAERQADIPPIPDPAPVLGLHIEPAPDIIPLCRLCGGLVKGGECERCGGKVCPACKATSYATETFCHKCRTPF